MANYFKNVKSFEELKTLYRTLLKENHPDNGGELETMQEINVQFDIAFKIWKDRAIKANTITEEEKKETAETTRRSFYTANGWEGSRYNSNLSLKEIAKIVRGYVKEKYPTFRFSVRTSYASMCQELHVALTQAPHDIYMSADDLRAYGLMHYPTMPDGTISEFEQYKEDISLMMRRWRDRNIFTLDCWSDEDIFTTYASLTQDQLHWNGLLKEDISEMIKDVDDFVNSYNYDDCDGMIDYFDVNFYYFNCKYSDVKIVPKTARIKDTKQEVKTTTTETKETASNIEYTIEESTHTKTGETIYLVKPVETLDKETFNAERDRMKENGGYYSRFTHSFVFSEYPTFLENTASIENVDTAQELTETPQPEESALIEEKAVEQEQKSAQQQTDESIVIDSTESKEKDTILELLQEFECKLYYALDENNTPEAKEAHKAIENALQAYYNSTHNIEPQPEEQPKSNIDLSEFFKKYGYTSETAEHTLHIYARHAESYHKQSDVIRAIDSATQEIDRLNKYAEYLKAHRIELANRYNYLSTSPTRKKVKLQRQRNHYSNKVNYFIIYFDVNLNDMQEVETDRTAYAGKDRKQAIEDFESIVKLHPEYITEKDIEKARWEH